MPEGLSNRNEANTKNVNEDQNNNQYEGVDLSTSELISKEIKLEMEDMTTAHAELRLDKALYEKVFPDGFELHHDDAPETPNTVKMLRDVFRKAESNLAQLSEKRRKALEGNSGELLN